MMKRTLYVILPALLLSLLPSTLAAQKICAVTGRYTYAVSDGDNITLKEAKRKCIELAKAEAIREAFGEMITSDVIDSRAVAGGESQKSYFWENTVAMARGEWIADTHEPIVSVNYAEGKLIFTAVVEGKAREILQAKADLKWEVLKEADGHFVGTDAFLSGDRIALSFRAPVDGYLAVYLIVGDDEAFCLLPYPKDADGRFEVRGGRDYLLFDREWDADAYNYVMKTSYEQEENQIVVVYSQNPFLKCNETSGDTRHPGSLNTHDFQKWLLRCQRHDAEMVVDKKWVRISKPKK